ncbi:MAG: hypothetical protein WBB29_21635 [Geitlerinemataceae cyanobacterium]
MGGSISLIHLATHGEFPAGDPSQSYIQLWDEQLSIDPPVELLVLSALRFAPTKQDV